MKKRVVVTGLGVVSCFGNDLKKYFQSLLEGKSGVSKISGFPCEDFTTQIAAEIKDFDPEGYLDRKQARRVDKFISYTIVAGKKALEHAHLGEEERANLDLTRCGIIVGSGMGGMTNFVDGVLTLDQKGPRRVSPFFIPYIITNMGGGDVGDGDRV